MLPKKSGKQECTPEKKREEMKKGPTTLGKVHVKQ